MAAPAHTHRHRGFTLVEVLTVMGLIGVLAGITTVNLIRPQNTATLDGTVQKLVADIKGQQMRAMAGDTIDATTAAPHGVYVQTNDYTLFKGSSYVAGNSNNAVYTAESGVTYSASPSAQLLFAQSSGDASGATSITITNTFSGQSKVITINRFGAVTVN